MGTVGCSQEKEKQAGITTDQEKKAHLLYVEWSSEVASTNVVRVVLEDLGYQVTITPVSAAAMWQAVAGGDADGLVAAWLPTTHGHYLKAVADKVDDLGPNLEGTKIGLVVPSYVTIDSILELNANADKFDKRIIGIDPGAGLMSKTEQAVQDYELTNLKLIEGSGATMTASKMARGEIPGAEGSIGKLFWSELYQRMMSLAMELEGPYDQLVTGSDEAIDNGWWQKEYLYSACHTLAGGTSEIQRNIIAERILGLPKDTARVNVKEGR